MYETKNKDAIIYNFSSVGEFMDMAEQSDFDAGGADYDWAFGSDKEADNRNKTYSLLRAGRGLSSVRKLSQKYRQEFQNSNLGEIMQRVQSIKRVRKFNDYNGNLEIDRVMAGDPNYLERVERTGKAKVVRIGINFCISCGNQLKDFSRLVALSAIFAEILENMGYGVEVYGSALWQTHRGRGLKNGMGMQFPVKSATEPLDFDRIYSLGLTGLLRDAQFRVEHHLTDQYGGRCIEPSQEMLKLAEIDVIVEKSWTDNGNQVEQIVKVIESL
tara:strand:+ start:320 stop:1135 length:816 start_codon:yes stop_codon:yes gene_type:complete